MLVVFGFGTGIITARILGPHDRGLFTLLIMLPQTLVTFAKMGVAQANVYYVRRARCPVSTVASNSLVLTLAVSLLLLVGLLLRRALDHRPLHRRRAPGRTSGSRSC